MAKYICTPQDMAANAANNYCEHEDGKILYYPQATIDEDRDGFITKMKTQWGYEIRAVEAVSKDFVTRALNSYERNTDWSAFKRKDWQAAVDWNNAR